MNSFESSDCLDTELYPHPDQFGLSTKYIPRALRLIHWPNPILSTVCADVEIFDEEIKQFAYSLIITMKRYNGIGLAAPQVGRTINVIAIEQSWENVNTPRLFINPKIKSTSTNTHSIREGCLSVPGYFEKRKRPYAVVLDYNDVDGTKQTIELHGINAFVVQHEIDHLNGKVFVDHLSKLKQNRIQKKIKNIL